ncbi:MAG: DUF2167 domain-containing protein [Candidatus Pacebacteria bacterium]|nr:DUF2167 domain-containing protein [Candidatus Paceibacterota bacterium]
MKNLKTLVLGALMFIPFFGASAATSLFGDFEGKEDYDRLWAFVENAELVGNVDTMTDEEKVKQVSDAIESQLHYSPSGSTVLIAGGKVTMTLPDGYRFLPKGEALFLYEVAQEEKADEEIKKSMQGVLVYDGRFMDQSAIRMYLNHYDEGYISDEDASTIDGEEMAADLDKQTEKDNENKGDDEVKLVDTVWIQKPLYDSKAHTFSFSNYFNEVISGEVALTTVNANITILGRTGLLSVGIVSDKKRIEEIGPITKEVNQMISFTEGNRYTDYNAATDKKSDITIAGLAAGVVGVKVLAKLGIWAVIAKFGKLIVLGVILFFGKIKNGIRKMRGLEVEENTPSETPATESTTPEKITDLPSPDTK